VLARDGQLLTAMPAQGGIWRLRTTPDDVDPRYLALLIAAEDRNFRAHPGIDPAALARAAWQYLSNGHIVSGGSTLTMQTARLLEPHPRSLVGKLHDLIRALQLEARYSKPDILGMYLTLAPMGGNIEGVRAASLAWFGHDPAHLSQAEAAVLVAIPQSPARRRPDRHPLAAQQAAAHLLRRLAAAGTLPPFWTAPALTVAPAPAPTTWPAPAPSALTARDLPGLLPANAPVQPPATPAPASADQQGAPAITRHAMPATAALFCANLARHAPPGARIRSTIDATLQTRLDSQLARAMAADGPEIGVALLAVDNASREIRASIGGRGPGFAGAALDLTRRRRSPGSALKPFIYGLAFDALMLHPLTAIEDAPNLIAGYAPHNFDYQYHGTITAQTALRQSFNVPAIQVLARVGPEHFIASLRQAGARVALPGNRRASLAVALGGLGIDLSDMVMLYAALGDDGRGAPLVTTPGQTAAKTPFMGRLAVFYLRQILEGSPPPPGMAYAALTGGRAIAFKTGTSYGFRDAWAVGYSATTTIGVWTGRVEGTPRPGAFGRATAAPLMLNAFALLPPETAPEPIPPPNAILATTTADLPAGLRHLGHANTAGPHPVLDFPPAGSTIDLIAAPAGGYAPVTLRARGGTPPFRWVINGMPQQGHEASLAWRPDGPGFAAVTIIDATDRAAGAVFRLAPDL
jgi:penicillin-binding protein 1C